jgi:hypothetical protein
MPRLPHLWLHRFSAVGDYPSPMVESGESETEVAVYLQGLPDKAA